MEPAFQPGHELNALFSKSLSEDRTHNADFMQQLSRDPVLTYLDVNGTLAVWKKYGEDLDEDALTESRKALSEVNFRSLSTVMISSGRALAGVTPIAPFLRDIPIDLLGTTNGLQLFVNRERLPAERWVAQLDHDQEDQGWARELREKHGFDLAILVDTMTQTLIDNGFIPAKQLGLRAYDPGRSAFVRPLPSMFPDDESLKNVNYSDLPKQALVLVSMYKGGTSLIFENAYESNGHSVLGTLPGGEDADRSPINFRNEKKENEWIDRKIIRPIMEVLASKGLSVRDRYFPYWHTMLFDVIPRIGDGKKILIDYVLQNYCTQARDVIAAGDAFTDAEMLETLSFTFSQGGTGRLVHMHLVQIGDNPELFERLRVHPRLIKRECGELGQAVREQFMKYLRIEAFGLARDKK